MFPVHMLCGSCMGGKCRENAKAFNIHVVLDCASIFVIICLDEIASGQLKSYNINKHSCPIPKPHNSYDVTSFSSFFVCGEVLIRTWDSPLDVIAASHVVMQS